MSDSYMTPAQADWWKSALEALLREKQLITVSSHELYDWEPEIRSDEEVREVLAHHLEHGSWVAISTTCGLWTSISDVRIDADHTTVRVKGRAPSGYEYRWAFRVVDEDGRYREIFRTLMMESWRRPWREAVTV